MQKKEASRILPRTYLKALWLATVAMCVWKAEEFFLIFILLSSPQLGSVNLTESQWELEQATRGHVLRKIILEESKVRSWPPKSTFNEGKDLNCIANNRNV